MSGVTALIFNGITNDDGSAPLGVSRPAGAHKLATLLREKNCDVEVVDFFNYWKLNEIKELITSRCSDKTIFIGWSLTFFVCDPSSFQELVLWIRSNYPKIKLIGGGTTTSFSKAFGLDYYIDGYIEHALEDLLNELRTGESLVPVEKLQSGGYYVNTLKEYSNKSWGNLRLKYEFRDFLKTGESLTLEMSRGCAFKCRFCSFPITGLTSTDHIRSSSSLREEMDDNYRLYGISSYVLSEETVNDSIVKLEVLLEAVEGLSFRPEFRGFFRADLVWSKPETIEMMSKINITGMHFGIESFNKKSAISIGKGLDSQKIKEALKSLRKIFGDRLNMQGSFIVGLPYETKETLMETQDWLMSADNPLDSWVWYPLAIPDMESKLKSSDMSLNFEKYGFEKWKVPLRDTRYICWKNDQFNYLSAILTSRELESYSWQYKKLGPWSVGACQALDMNYEALRNSFYGKSPRVPFDVIKKQSLEFISDYKRKKLQLSFV